MTRQRTHRQTSLLFTSFAASLAAAVACSAPPGAGGDNSLPEFSGPPPAGGGVTPTTNPSTNPPSGAPVANQTPEVIGQTPGNVPVDNAGAGGSSAAPASSNGNAAGSNATGGTAAVPTEVPATPNAGAGGSAMPSAAGSGNAPVDNGQNNNPTPPVTPPPPVTPDPGPVGTGCAPGAAFFCEDFESFGVGTAQQNDLWRPEGNVSIDGQIVQGTRSLHVQANAGQASRIFVNGFAPPNNSFFGRMNVFVQSFPTSPNFAHYVLVEVTGNGGERVRPIGGQLIQDNATGNVWGVGSDGGATGDWTAWRATAPAEGGQWLCMEWQMDASDNSIDVYIDGTLKPELSVSANSHDGNQVPFVFPTFNNIWLGWTVFQGGSVPAPFNVYLDDIVLSTQRVGCN